MAGSAAWRVDLMQGEAEMGMDATAAMRGDDRQRAYRAARRHSGRVRLAKLVLPSIATAGILFVSGYLWLSRMTPHVTFDLSAGAIRDGKLVMANPKLDGFTADNRPYSVRAARAAQDLTGTGAVELEHIQATLPLDDNVKARVEAPAGIYNSDANTLDVTDSLTVETTDGKRAELGATLIDLAAGSLSTGDAVRISMPGAVLEAGRMRVEDSGKRLLFERHVTVVVQPGVFRPAVSEAETGDGSGG